MREIKFRTAMAKAALSKNNTFFNSKLDFRFKEETSKMMKLVLNRGHF